MYEVDGDIKVMMGAHVDDDLWAAKPGYEFVMDTLLQQFEVKEIHEGKFKFCGREYEQKDDFSVFISCRGNTENILPINFNRAGRSPESKATVGEISQLRSVNGSLLWIARQCRIEFCYRCSKLQSVAPTAQVKHLEACNQLLNEAKETAGQGILYKAGAFDFQKAILLTISDASWANDEKIVDDKVFPRRSQYGRINELGDPRLWDSDEGALHIIGWKSGLIKRTCRSTFRAETHGIIYAKEATDGILAMIADMRGKFDKNNWEAACAREVRSLCLADCQSLRDYLINPIAAGIENKRLEIDLESLRESLWEHPDGRPKYEITEDQTDKPIWIDTSCMPCDPLTKAGTAHFPLRRRRAMSTGILDLVPTVESQLKKLQQQRARMRNIPSGDLAHEA